MQNRIYVADNHIKNGNVLSGMIVCALLSAGIAGVFASLTHDVLSTVFILLEAVVLSAILAVLERKDAALNIFRAAAVIVFAIWVMLDFTGIRRAMLNTVNSVVAYANEAFSKDIVHLGVQEASSGDYIALFAILNAVTTMLVHYFVSKRAVVWLTLLSFIFLITALALRVTGSAMILPLIITGWVGCWSKCSAGDAKSVAYICIGMAAVFVVGMFVTGSTGFNGFGGLEELHDDTSDFIYKLRFGEDLLPEGDLFEADTMLDNSKATMTVTFEKPEAVYLKGFTGGSFTENKWIEYDEGTYLGEWSGMLDYFRINKFGPNNIYSQYKAADGKDIDTNIITVENTGADRSRVYLPFTAEAVENVGVYSYRDLGIRSNKLFGAKKYSFVNIAIEEKPERLSADSWVGGTSDEKKADYLKKENVYRAFVKDTYLDIDEKTKSEIDEIFYKDFDMDSEEVGVYTITTRIRSILRLTASYTENPPEPEDKDFIGWFLASSRKGNAAYYATAAVMAYRAAGIPARYAEGYFVSETDVSNLNMTKKNSIVLSGRNAHAWVEIYRDGIGWVSVEVTPGFYIEDTEEMEVIDISHTVDATGGLNGSGSENYTGSLSMYSPEKATRPADRMSSGMRILLILICLLTIFAMIMYIRYIILIYLKNERIYGQAKEDTANYMMMYLCGALVADGVEANPDNTTALRRELLDKYEEFTPQEFDRVVSLISRSSYGGARLREHELRTIRIFIEKLSAEVYKNKSWWKKIILRYVRIV